MKDFSMIDSHIHLWDKNHLHYPWLQTLPALDQSFLLEDFSNATRGVKVDAMVFVQAECERQDARREVEWVTQCAERDPRIKGIVAFAPLELGAAAQYDLAWLQKQPLVKGVRRLIQSENAEDFCRQADFIEGVRLLATYGLSFDLCIYAQQLPAVLKLVERCPDVHFILNHLGKPNIVKKQFDDWSAAIALLAQSPKVSCKLSGVLTEAGENWQMSDLEPYLTTVLDYFGTDRVMFGSDWPVVNLAGSYTEWVDTLFGLLKNLQAPALQKIFCENAKRVYRL